MILSIAILAAIFGGELTAAEPSPQRLFKSGEAYPRYRIPSLILAPDGSLLAVCEGRKNGGGLTGNIDIVARRSLDHGKTWQPLEVLLDHGAETLGNPCMLIDRTNKRLWMAFTRSPGEYTEAQIVKGESPESTRVFVASSDDNGRTWKTPNDITKFVKKSTWNGYGTGPGTGIQLKNGRLLIPAYHVESADQTYRSHSIYSDDHGKSWKLGATVGDNTSEAHIVERTDGSLVMDTRTVVGREKRTWATSTDGGETWSDPMFNESLFDPHCEACMIRVPRKISGKTQWLFSNPVGPKRHNLTIHHSEDEGRTWKTGLLIQEGDSQYSSLAVLPNGRIGCLYDRWTEGNYHLFYTDVDLSDIIGK